MKKILNLLVLLLAMSMVFSSLTFAAVGQATDKTCEQCGMVVDATSQAHFKVVDSNGGQHYVECMMCALKLLAKFPSLNITTYCDYNGPNSVIIVDARQNGTTVTVNPPTAMVIAGGGCAKNRVVSSPAAASALLANNGTSNYLAPIQKYVNSANGTIVTVVPSANIMTLAQAAVQFGGASVSPSPSPTGAPQVCESCGMNVAPDAQAHFKIVDREGHLHYACCIKCAIKVITKEDQATLTTNCDWYGTNFPITVTAGTSLSSATIAPSTAMIIDGSCMKNRVVYDSNAANWLLANNGSSRFLVASQNTTILSNATIMSLDQAVKTYGVGASPSPTPTATSSPYPSSTPTVSSTPTATATPTVAPTYSPTATPTSTPTITPTSTPTPVATSTISPTQTVQPTTTATATATPSTSPSSSSAPWTYPSNVPMQQCEACGMDVSAESQARYKVTDGNGNVHYAECFMCALNLINDYEKLHIETFCDWYGPSYPIVIDTSDYGRTAAITPTTAIFLKGGSCVTARAAYNQAAADALLSNGYSQYTSPEQKYALPSGTIVQTVQDAVVAIAQNSPTKVQQNTQNTTALIAVAAIGIVVIAVAVVAFRKFKK